MEHEDKLQVVLDFVAYNAKRHVEPEKVKLLARELSLELRNKRLKISLSMEDALPLFDKEDEE